MRTFGQDPVCALVWMARVLGALAYLHDRGIIHRDAKPANLRITPGGQVLLIDSGLAKEYDPLQRTTTGARGAAWLYEQPFQAKTPFDRPHAAGKQRSAPLYKHDVLEPI